MGSSPTKETRDEIIKSTDDQAGEQNAQRVNIFFTF